MIIRQRRIRSIDRHFGFMGQGDRLVLGVRDLARFEGELRRVGFILPLSESDTILPSPEFGPISSFNADGKNIIHRDRPMETAYRLVEWHWTEWRGRDETEEMTGFFDRPYRRYPRTFVDPPSVELTIRFDAQDNPVVVTAPINFGPDHHDETIHAVNLLLEIFGECEVFTENLESFLVPQVRRLNWDILPPGRYPWERLHRHVEQIIDHAKEGNRPLIKNRFETVNSYGPEFHAVGRAGFRGYVVFGFPEKGLFVFESAYTGNATYVFNEDWEGLSTLTKAEILDEGLQEDRLIHREGWHQRVHSLLS